MQLQFLGTGAGMPSKQRNTSCCILELYNERNAAWMFDCGEATQHQILQTPIKPRKIEKIFITHLHGDHIYGLPGFISSRSFLAGDEHLTIYGPKGLKRWIDVTLEISQTHIKYPFTVIEIEEGTIFEDEQFIVEAAPLEHIIPCFGYRIIQKDLAGSLNSEKAFALGVPKGPLLGLLKSGQSVTLPNGNVVDSVDVLGDMRKGKIITYLGDTKYCEKSIALSKDADVVVHEATFDHATEQLAALYGHSTNIEAANVAKQAGAKMLILSHISARFLASDLDRILVDAQNVFAPTYLAHDFAIFPIND